MAYSFEQHTSISESYQYLESEMIYVPADQPVDLDVINCGVCKIIDNMNIMTCSTQYKYCGTYGALDAWTNSNE